MKTKQTTIHRSGAKWLPSAMALAATTASSQAATVQITLSGFRHASDAPRVNWTNSQDLTGDRVDDVTVQFLSAGTYTAGVKVNGGAALFAARVGYKRIRTSSLSDLKYSWRRCQLVDAWSLADTACRGRLSVVLAKFQTTA